MGCIPSKTIHYNSIFVTPCPPSESNQANNNQNRPIKETENRQLQNSIAQTAALNTKNMTQTQKNKALLEAIHEKNLHKIQNLIKDGADINTTDQSGNTPLMHAITIETVGTVDALLNNKANLEIKNNNEMTALALAITLYNTSEQNSKDLNTLASNGNKNRYIAILHSLLSRKASIGTLVTEEQQTYFALATKYNDSTFFDILYEYYDHGKIDKLYEIKDRTGRSAQDFL